MRKYIVEFWRFTEMQYSVDVEAINEAAALIQALAKLHSSCWIITHGYTITMRSG